MRILITNDDGINAPGLKVAEAIAAEIAGEADELWTVAPAFEQSGVGHCISYTHPTMISELGPRRWAAEGSPADCVLAGIHDILPGRPDLIISGVNRGNNAAENVLYSGTIGGAMEGALQGIPAIAMSQFLGPGTAGLDDPFEGAARWGARVARAILEARIENDSAYHVFHTVNFPPCPAASVAGVRVCPQGRRPDVSFSVEPHIAPSGRRFNWVRGGNQQVRSEDGSDAALNLDGYVTVTPLRADLTAHDRIGALGEAMGRALG